MPTVAHIRHSGSGALKHAVKGRALKWACATLALGCACAARAALLCDAPEHAFGTQPDTNLGFSHTFEVRNAGEEALEIKAVRSSCDCVTAEMASRTLRPGQQASIDAHFSFRGETGPQLRAIHVAYRSAGSPESEPPQVCTLTLRGSILSPVIRLPNVLDLGMVLPDSVATGTISLVSGRCGAFALGPVGFGAGGGRAEYAAGVTGTNHLLRLLIPVPPRAGAFAGMALVSTDLAEMPNVPVRYGGRSASILEVRPPFLTVLRGQPLNARFLVASPYGAAFRILSASATDPRVSVAVAQDAAEARLTVTAEASAETFTDALVRLTTDHPVCRVIEVPIRATPRH